MPDRVTADSSHHPERALMAVCRAWHDEFHVGAIFTLCSHHLCQEAMRVASGLTNTPPSRKAEIERLDTIRSVLDAWETYDYETRRLGGPLECLIQDQLDILDGTIAHRARVSRPPPNNPPAEPK